MIIKSKRLQERTVKGYLWTVSGSGIQAILKIGVLSIMARLVSPEEYGLVGIAVIAIGFSKMFTEMGVGPAIVQLKTLEVRHLKAGFFSSLLLGLFFSTGLVLASSHLENFFQMEELGKVLQVVAIVFLLDSVTLVGQALMQRNMKLKEMASIDIVSYLLGYGIVGITLGLLGWGKWALICALLVQSLTHTILILALQPFPKRISLERNALYDLLHYGGGITLARIANYIALQGDNLVIGKMLGPAALGIYGRAYQFMVMPATLFGASLDRALFPAMSKVQDDKSRLSTAYLTGISFIALAGIPLSILHVILAPELVMVLLGPKWIEVVLPFQILACSLLFRMSYKISDTLVNSLGAVYKRAWRQGLYASMVLVGSFIGQFWGIVGVACGVAVALLLNFLFMAHLSIQLVGITWLDVIRVHRQGIQIGLLSGSLTYFVVTFCRQFFHSPFMILIITLASFGVSIVILIWILNNKFLSKEQKEIFRSIVPTKVYRIFQNKESKLIDQRT